MVRPRKCRQVIRMPRVRYFKPGGIPLRELSEVYLGVDEAEALRLVDHEGLDQSRAAAQMGISRHTLGRTLGRARKVVARAITEGLAIRIDGGDFTVRDDDQEQRREKNNRKQTGPDAKIGLSGQQGDGTMSRIAISSEGPGMDDMVDPRFGRAGGFVIVDTETMETDYIDNGTSQTMSHGAGLQAAENVAKAGVDVVLSGYIGPKAFQALTSVGIRIGQGCAGMTVREAVEKFKNNAIEMATSPTRQAHS